MLVKTTACQSWRFFQTVYIYNAHQDVAQCTFMFIVDNVTNLS